jgi:hypothetical protein
LRVLQPVKNSKAAAKIDNKSLFMMNLLKKLIKRNV